ncbi:Phosphate starvation-inducible protein PsiF precursor [Pigmentiphaga humi]|uniref:Phosphate starvation-inducible protein PsiF n=1 Tax=Pigmentiphaga humi TaxID=2478468 RepID=A0A3P4B206_9BURK|nr:PsiF family protein [Pigmentiphaga humi]VCU69688.1 Phosphate starvation-inducible protein PsiF precursor [Pigmentiphaga humi]
MKKLLAASMTACFLAGALPAIAAENSQQSRMATCNKEAGDTKGEERKAFMKECLSTKKKLTQQEKMTACNKQAAGKKGDERKAFMSQCLRG